MWIGAGKGRCVFTFDEIFYFHGLNSLHVFVSVLLWVGFVLACVVLC